MINVIKKYICERHGLITDRKTMRRHLAENHARDNFQRLEVVEGKGVWRREDFV